MKENAYNSGKKSYCYHTRDYMSGEKLSGGMLHATSLEEASKIAIKRSRLTLEVTGYRENPRTNWVNSYGRKCLLYVSVHADKHIDDEAKQRINELPSLYNYL